VTTLIRFAFPSYFRFLKNFFFLRGPETSRPRNKRALPPVRRPIFLFFSSQPPHLFLPCLPPPLFFFTVLLKFGDRFFSFVSVIRFPFFCESDLLLTPQAFYAGLSPLPTFPWLLLFSTFISPFAFFPPIPFIGRKPADQNFYFLRATPTSSFVFSCPAPLSSCFSRPFPTSRDENLNALLCTAGLVLPV